MRKAVSVALLCITISIWPLPALAKTTWDVATGFDYSTGKYGGSSDTSILSVPLGLRAQMGKVRLELTVPYLDVKGPGTSAGGVVVGGNNAITTRSGLGDITAGAAWTLQQGSSFLPGIELAGSVKVPTASSALGTGKFDYNAQTNLNYSISQRVMLFGSLGYSWLSDFRGFNLEDGVTANGGLNFKSSDSTNIGVSANYRQAYYQTLDDQISLTPYALWTFAKHWRVSGYGLVGFTNSSPNIGGGLRLIFFKP
ncbi:MAG: hypothetical protein RL274_2175 [Pseudomonadota bacterium]|jgi:hypothetical protein